MKKFLKILFIVVLALIVLMISVPYLFKGEILKETKSVINEKVNAKVEFTDVNLSLFKHFPNLNIGLEQLSISGKGQFEKDTLVQFESFNVAVDLISVINKNIKVKGVYLVRPSINAVVAKDSAVNWDIMPPSEELEEEKQVDTATTTTDYRIQLKEFRIDDAEISYTDHTSDLYAHLDHFNFRLAGDLGADSSYVDINLNIDPILVQMGAVKYLNNSSLSFDAGVGANIKNGRYHLLENQFALNELILNFEGLVEMAKDDKILTDINFHTNKPNFKDLLSLVPAIYTKDFSQLKTQGQLSLNGKISGYYKDNIMPDLDLNLLVENGMINYPDLPKKLQDINISLQTYFNGKDNDQSLVNLEKFHWKLGENPFDASFKLTTPISDPSIQGSMNGKIDLSTFAEVIPMEETELKGLIRTNLSMAGKMSMIEKEKYEQFKADGGIELTDFYFTALSVPVPVSISEANLQFSPQYVGLQSFNATFGKSDLSASGKIENFLAYALEDGTIRGDFSVQSSYFNANEFLTEGEAEETVEDTINQEMTVFEVPERIDFKLNSRFDKIIYDQMDIKNASGAILVKNQTLYLDDFKMELFDGSLRANGEYSTKDPTDPKVNFDFAVNELRIENALRSFSVLDTLVPIMRNTKGDISLEMQFMSSLMPDMQPDINTMKGFGKLTSDQIQLEGSKSLGTIMQKLKLTKGKSQTVEDILIKFAIENGRIEVKPFDVKMGEVDMNISGSQGIDQTMDYLIDMQLPKGKLGKAADEALNNLIAQATSSEYQVKTGSSINVAAKLTGNFDDPKVNLLFGKGKEGEQPSAKEQVKEKVKEELDKQKEKAGEKARKEASKRAEQIIKEAEEKAAKIRQQARKTAQQIREEADKKADKIEKEAEGKNFVVRKAAEKSAKELRNQADKKADKVVAEADKKAKRLIQEAKEQAEKIKKEAE